MSGERVKEAIARGAARLRAAGIDLPRLEARLLLAHALGVSVEELLGGFVACSAYEDVDGRAKPGHDEGGRAGGVFDALLERRAKREPLALILGHKEFWSLRFRVSRATLIPRPESETVIETALSLFQDRRQPLRMLDLGTGTGCLLLAALHEFPNACGIGTDRNEAAAALARRNAEELGLSRRAMFLCGDWDAALSGRFDLVLSNPPYIESAAIAALMPDVALHEPRSALDGGADGLDAYRVLLARLPGRLTPGGAAVLEIGTGQLEAVRGLAKRQGLTMYWREDVAGTPRAVVLRNTLP